ncbi:MAG: hypothetical protein ACUVYA_12310 [Planctomycetota bacterium]
MTGDRPLEDSRAEDVRRIDIASRWATAIMLAARCGEWRDALIHLVLLTFRRRRLIVIRGYHEAHRRAAEASRGPYANLRGILGRLWASCEEVLTNA